MKTALGVTVLILIAAVIIYYFWFSFAWKNTRGGVSLIPDGYQHKSMSIRQIDSLTAGINYGFTIKNKIVHMPGPDSIMVPVKGENPAG
jgi:hypothetical protein